MIERTLFDQNIKFGDIYYDFAKIYHGLLVKHSMVKANKFDVKIKKKNLYKYIKKYKPYSLMIKYLFKYLQKNGYSEYKLKIITSLIFLNISPLHEGKYGIFLYYLGKQMLSETLNFHSKNNPNDKKKINFYILLYLSSNLTISSSSVVEHSIYSISSSSAIILCFTLGLIVYVSPGAKI